MLLGGFVFFTISDNAWRIAILSIGALLLLFAIFAWMKVLKGKALAVICATAILLGCFFSYLYFDLHFCIDDKYTDEVKISGVVTDASNYSYGRNLTISIETVNGKKVPDYKVLAFASLDECEGISDGSRITATGKIIGFAEESDPDTAAYYYASGYSARITEIKDINHVEYAGSSLAAKLINYRKALCRRIIVNSNEESGGLLCALLLGERSYLSSETKHDFARVGLSHILALSGMHLAIISFAIEALLSRLGIMKKPRKIILIIFTLLYMSLTGFPTSVMRAGIMLIITSLLFLLSHRADSITTLFIAIVVILIAQPYAVFDIALWLSAAATLGILIFTEFRETLDKSKKPSLRKRIINAIIFPVLISLFAFGATFLMSAANFKSFSILAPVTTPIYSIIVEIYMYLGILLLMCGRFLSLGAIARLVGSFITDSIRCISLINGIYVSAEYIIISVMLIVFTISFCAFAILNIKRKRSAVALLVSMICAVFAVAFSCSVYSKNVDYFEYVVNENNEWIIMQDGDTNVILDISTPSYKTAGIGADELKKLKLCELDRYVFTAYSVGTIDAVDALLGSIFVEEIYLPAPQNENEFLIAEKIVSDNQKSKTAFTFYKDEEFIECGEFAIFPAYRSSEKNKLALTILHCDEFYTYLSSGMLENDTKNVALPLIDGCNTLILGRHGNSYSDYKFIYQVNDLQRLVISSKSLTIPSETARYYNEQGTRLDYYPEKTGLYVE